jgi:hypothetical protein
VVKTDDVSQGRETVNALLKAAAGLMGGQTRTTRVGDLAATEAALGPVSIYATAYDDRVVVSTSKRGIEDLRDDAAASPELRIEVVEEDDIDDGPSDAERHKDSGISRAPRYRRTCGRGRFDEFKVHFRSLAALMTSRANPCGLPQRAPSTRKLSRRSQQTCCCSGPENLYFPFGYWLNTSSMQRRMSPQSGVDRQCGVDAFKSLGSSRVGIPKAPRPETRSVRESGNNE